MDGHCLDDGAALRVRPLRRGRQALRIRRLGRRRHRSASLSDPDSLSRVCDSGSRQSKIYLKKENEEISWLHVLYGLVGGPENSSVAWKSFLEA